MKRDNVDRLLDLQKKRGWLLEAEDALNRVAHSIFPFDKDKTDAIEVLKKIREMKTRNARDIENVAFDVRGGVLE